MIPQEYIQEVVRRNDIEDIVGQYVQLRRRGRTLTGLCPFHNEKTPSFVVYPDTQSFYCFGCGAAGDVIRFVRKYNNLGYVETVKQLASRAGMPLPEEDDKESRARQRLLEINRCAARYFYEQLNARTPEAVAVLGTTKSQRITTMITDLIEHSQNGRINFSPEVDAAYAVLKDFMYSTVYVDKEAKREEKKVDKLVAELYERLCEEPTLMPNFYLQIAYNEGVDRAVTDYISGMSDEFATRLFEDLFVPQKWTVL